jgi:DNA-binding transcriptional MerR regulator
MPDTEFTIGHLARQTGVKVPTIRYYEQVGLLPAPPRSPGNQRLYGNTHLARLSFIRHCRELGFSQAVIRDLLGLSDNPDQSCDSVATIARAKRDEIDCRITRLTDLRSELDRMITACTGGPIRDCRIVEALAGNVEGRNPCSPTPDTPGSS